jgi:hypothetical protein
MPAKTLKSGGRPIAVKEFFLTGSVRTNRTAVPLPTIGPGEYAAAPGRSEQPGPARLWDKTRRTDRTSRQSAAFRSLHRILRRPGPQLGAAPTPRPGTWARSVAHRDRPRWLRRGPRTGRRQPRPVESLLRRAAASGPYRVRKPSARPCGGGKPAMRSLRIRPPLAKRRGRSAPGWLRRRTLGSKRHPRWYSGNVRPRTDWCAVRRTVAGPGAMEPPAWRACT